MLEVDVNRRSSVGIRMLCINFCDPVSLLTWLEMRRMSLDVGKRFFVRIQFNIGCFIGIMLLYVSLLMLKGLGYVDWYPFMLV